MRKRQLLVAVVASVTMSLGLVTPASADDPAQDKAKVDQQLAAAQSDVHESTEAVAVAAARLAELNDQLVTAQGALTAAEDQLTAARAEDQRLAAELAAAQSAERAAETALAEIEDSITADRDVLSGMARSAYQGGQLSQVSALLESQSFGDYTQRSEAMRSVLRAQSAVVDSLADDRAQQANRQASLEGVRERVDAARLEAAANVVTKNQLEQDAAAATEAVAQLKSQQAQALAEAQSTLAEDEAEYAALQAENSRLEAELAQRAADAARTAPAPAPPSGQSSGILYRPVSGWITSPYGMRKHPISGIWKLHDGTDFGESCGTPIRAAASGTVLSTRYAGGYGNQTVIEHGIVNGVSLATSYNHQSRFGVSAGQHVDRGQVIGYVGTTGYSTGCHLHFMVYVNGSTTDPMNWL